MAFFHRDTTSPQLSDAMLLVFALRGDRIYNYVPKSQPVARCGNCLHFAPFDDVNLNTRGRCDKHGVEVPAGWCCGCIGWERHDEIIVGGFGTAKVVKK